MKVRMVFESSGSYMLVEAETESEDKMLNAAFANHELRCVGSFDRSYGGGGYAMHTDRHASIKVSLFID